MDTQWLESASDRLAVALQQASARLQGLAEPQRVRQIRSGLYALACLWLLWTLSSLIWNLVPQPVPEAVPGKLINPLSGPAEAAGRREVDIEALAGWSLFGTVASTPDPARLAAEAAAATRAASDLDGIENRAKETRLALKLQGIVASSDPEAARAIIESKRKQQQYAVGDELPVSGNVKVAKILADRVVLDNGGRYELLILYEKNAISSSAAAPLQAPAAPTPARRLDRRNMRDVTEMASTYRRQLYSNPQSLSSVVKIAPVREGGQLRGYRVSAGKDRRQFESLGFKANDVVTGVNGIELTDPGKAMELYRVMRSAEEASFNVLRDGESLTLVVGLEAEAGGEVSGDSQ